MKQTVESHVSNINGDMIKQINAIFDRDAKAPGVLIEGMETFVALLRNAKRANNVDVELYFGSYEKLIIKLGRIDPAQLKYDIVVIHQEKLSGLVKRFSGMDEGVNLDAYRPIMEWAAAFADYALKALEMAEKTKMIAKEEKNIKQQELNERRVHEVMRQLKEDNLEEFYDREARELDERIDAIQNIRDQDLRQAQEFQEHYHGFEKKYFENITRIIQGHRDENKT